MRVRRPNSRRSALRWLGTLLALSAGAATAIAMAPAHADTASVDAQLSLSGVATKGNIIGGTTIGVKPGTTVDFKASLLPTAGLDNIPTLGPALDKAVDALLGAQFQVVVTTTAGFPGGVQTVTVGGPKTGPCKAAPVWPVTFANAGSYDFSWTVRYVLPGLLGGCKASSINNADLNLLRKAGVALNVANQWLGQIVVATNPPPAGISLQLPGLTLAPSAGLLGQLPTIGLPQVNLPTLPVDVSSLVGALPSLGGGGSSSTGNPGTGNCVPCQVVPSPSRYGYHSEDANGVTQLAAGLSEPSLGPGQQQTVTATATAPNVRTTTKRLDFAANKAPAAQVPVLLAVIAMIALGLVTATYARLFLIRRG
jgi:hypothetical protein